MMRAYSIARQNGRTHKRDSSSIPGPSKIIKEESGDTFPSNDNEDVPVVASHEAAEGLSSQQTVMDNQSHIALSVASTDGDAANDRADTTTEIQQDLGADLNLDSFQYISPDKPEIAEATDSSESKGSDEPLAEVNSEAPCNTDLASAIPLSDDCAKTTETDKYISLSHPQVKDDQNTTAIDAQANTRNVVQEEEKYKAQLDNHIGSKTAVFTGFLERKSQQQAATSLAQKQHRQQALRSLESAHQRAASCMDGQDMYDNLPQSFKQQRKRKMSIRRLSDAFTWPKDPSVTEDKRRFSDMLSSPKQTRQLLRKKSSMLLNRIRSSFPAAKKDAQAAC
ncbi:unnamed protein product [Umbelopsis sp. WA50703]